VGTKAREAKDMGGREQARECARIKIRVRVRVKGPNI